MMRPILPLLAISLTVAFCLVRAQDRPADEQIQEHLRWMRANERGMMNVAPQEGQYLHDLIVRMNAKSVVEVGASNGYSGIWLATAVRKTGGKLITIELDERRGNLAAKNFKQTGVEDVIDFRRGDALKILPTLEGPLDVVFIDAWKPDYKTYLDMVYPKLRKGGVIAAHNVTSHPAEMKDFLDEIHNSPRFRTEMVKVGSAGLSVSYKLE